MLQNCRGYPTKLNMRLYEPSVQLLLHSQCTLSVCHSYTAYVQWVFVTTTQPTCSERLSQLHSLCAVNVCHSTLHRAKALSFPWREGGELEHIHRRSKPQWRTNKLEPQTAMCVDIKSRILILGGKSSMFWYAWGLYTHGMSPFLKHTKVGRDQIRYISSLLTAKPIFQTWRHEKKPYMVFSSTITGKIMTPSQHET